MYWLVGGHSRQTDASVSWRSYHKTDLDLRLAYDRGVVPALPNTRRIIQSCQSIRSPFGPLSQRRRSDGNDVIRRDRKVPSVEDVIEKFAADRVNNRPPELHGNAAAEQLVDDDNNSTRRQAPPNARCALRLRFSILDRGKGRRSRWRHNPERV